MLLYSHIAIIPFYGDDGSNRTRIIYTDGSIDVFDLPIKNYLQKMFIQSHLDPKFLQHWTHQIIGTKSNIPLTFTEHTIFIPIKFRQSFGKSDGCFGYVRTDAITTYNDLELSLANTLTLPTRSPRTYIAKKLKDAKLLSYAYTAERKKYEFMYD